MAAAATAAGLIAPSYIGLVREAKELRKKAELRRHAVAYVEHFARNGLVFQHIAEAHSKTELDRFIIFTAWRADDGNYYTSAEHQIRSGVQEFISYDDYKLDSHYEGILANIRTGDGHYRFVVEKEPQTAKLVGTYLNERVTDSILSLVYYDKSSDMTVYVSHATQVKEGISAQAAHLHEVIVDAMRLHASGFVT